MSSATLTNQATHIVLSKYPLHLSSGNLILLGNRGGFSGARLWRIDGPTPLLLRAWPTEEASAERLAGIHRLMEIARCAGLTFVPAVYATTEGKTWVAHENRLWDLTSWLPGRADFHERPTGSRLAAACTALARLHNVWTVAEPASLGPCPAIQRRMQTLSQWLDRVRSGWHPVIDGPAQPWADRAWVILPGHLERLPELLARWADKPLPLQPCLCDVWHDHILFEGDTVAGIIDYGGVKLDHVAVDLARLLGSMAGDDAGLRAAGLQAYARLRPLTLEEEELVGVLDRSGTLLGVANWLQWLDRDGRALEDREAAARRLAELVARVESWKVR